MALIHASLYLLAALCVFGNDATVFVRSQELDLLMPAHDDKSLCINNSECTHLVDACCPTAEGVQLDCCDASEEEVPDDADELEETEIATIPDVADGLDELQPLMGGANTNSLNNKKCKRFFTTTEDGEVLAYVNRKTGNTDIIGDFSKTKVFSLEQNFYNGVMYAIKTENNDDSTLMEVDPRSGKLKRVGDMGVKEAMGLASAGNQGNMYTISMEDKKLYEIDPRTGQAYEREKTRGNIIDIAYSIELGVIYATNGKDLFTINPFDGDTKKEGKIKDLPQGVSFTGLAITPNGNTLYGITDKEVGAEIWEINPKNLKATFESESVLRDPAVGGTIFCKNNKVPDNF